MLRRGVWLHHTHTHTHMSGIPIGARADSLLGRRRWPGAACTAPWSAAGRSADGSCGRTPRRPSRRPDRRGGSGCAGSAGAWSARPFRGCTVWPLGSGTVRACVLFVWSLCSGAAPQCVLLLFVCGWAFAVVMCVVFWVCSFRRSWVFGFKETKLTGDTKSFF